VSALLELEQARTDSGGAVLIDGLTLASTGDSVCLVGSWEPLFLLLEGRASVASGSVRIAGLDPRRGVRDGRIGLALAGAPLPEAWTAAAYLEQSAELAGIRPRAAKQAARAALSAIGLSHLETRRIATLTAAERRALAIAHATIGTPEVLAIEAPLAELDARSEALIGEVLARAAEGKRLLVSVAAPQPVGAERALLDRVAELFVLQAGVLVGRGSAAEAIRGDCRYGVLVTRRAPELAARLAEIGMTATLSGSRLVVELGDEHSTDDLLDASIALGAPIVELLPLEAK
jgi:ABC-type multidrug transport system ATPase subunit